MKMFKYPPARLLCQDVINTTKNRGLERILINHSPKLNQCKKTGSLDLSYCLSKKKKELQKIYRVQSCQKKVRNKSSSSFKSQMENKSNIKANNRFSNQSKELQIGDKKQKIILNTEKKGKYHFNDLQANIEILSDKLKRCYALKSDKHFVEEYANALRMDGLEKENNQEILSEFLKKISQCQERLMEKKMQTANEKISGLEKQKSTLNLQIKKIRVKEEVLNEEIRKLTERNSQLMKEIHKFKQKCHIDQGTQTGELHEDYGPYANEFPKLLKQLKMLRQKQNHMNILVNQLQRDGLNLQKVYKRGVKNLKKLKNSSSQQQENSQKSQTYLDYIQKSKQKHTHQKNKKPSPQKSHIRNKHDSDADDSIIDDMDAISFNYESKEQEMEVYTPKRVYVCEKKMDEGLKKQLQLNFQCLYEEDSGLYYNSAKDFPTI